MLWLLLEQWEKSICLRESQVMSLGTTQSWVQTGLQIWA